MTIYIDSEYKCHVTGDDTRRAFDVPFFDGKCAEFIEGYRYVPAGESWTRADGEVFRGEMISPWKDLSEAYIAQTAYLERRTVQYEAALSEIEAALGVTS